MFMFCLLTELLRFLPISNVLSNRKVVLFIAYLSIVLTYVGVILVIKKFIDCKYDVSSYTYLEGIYWRATFGH